MARRVNRRFVTILVLSVIGIAGAIVAAQQLLIRDHADHWIESGNQAMVDRKWLDAVNDFNHAAALSPRDPDLQMKLAAAIFASSDSQKSDSERAAYERALEIDPNYLPALRALVQWYQQVVVSTPSAQMYRSLIDTAQRASAQAPEDLTLSSISAMATVQKSLAGLETDPQDVINAISQLRDLMQKAPDNADFPYTVALAKVQQGQDLTRQNNGRRQPREATALYTEAVGMFENIFSGADGGPQDHNAEMHYRFAQVLETLASVDQSGPDDRARYLGRAQNEIDRARALVKDKDPKYLEINGYAVEMANRRGDRTLAIQILRSLPDLATVRLSLARLLGETSDTRPEAEKLLDRTLKALPGNPDQMDAFRFQAINLLTSLRIADYVDTADAAERQRLLDQIQTALGKMAEIGTMTDQWRGIVDTMEVTRLQARIDLINGKSIEVIQSLSRLLAQDPRAAKDANILLMLASAYESAQQNGKAISYLTDLLDQFPSYAPAKKMLAGLLLRESPAEAKTQIDQLEQELPNDPQVIADRISLLDLDPDKNKALIKTYFDRLPEGTLAEINDKAQRAIILRDWDDSIRLLEEVVAKNPSNVNSVVNLAKVYLITKQKDKAIAVATRGLKDNPDSSDLKLLIPMINGDDPARIAKLREDLAAQIPDPVQRELALATLANERGDVGVLESHLKAAEKLAPDDPRVWNELFQMYLRTNRLDEASIYVEKLAKAGYDQAGGDLYRFRLARARGDNGTALVIAQKLTQDKPEFATTWISLGEVLEAQGQYDQAVQQYAVALEKQNDNLVAIKGIIECYYGLGKTTEALAYINQGLTKDPDNATFREMLISHQLNYGNPDDAISAIQGELDRSPDNPKLVAALGNTYLRIAKILESQQHHDDAMKMVEESETVLKQALAKWPDEADIYLGLAEAALATNRFADAESILKQWAARDAWKGQVDPYLKLALFYERVHLPQLSEDAMRTAVAHSNYRVDLQIQLAELLSQHHKYDDALELLRATNSDNPSVEREVIQVLVAANRLDQAQAELKSTLDAKPSNAADLLTLWAQILLNHQQFDAAQDKAEQSLAIEPSNQVALFYRARAKLGKTPADLQGAIDDLTTLRQASPYVAEVRVTLADALIQQGKMDDAAVELEAALKVNRLNKTIRMHLVQIYMSGARVRFSEAMHLLQDVETTPPFDKDPDIFLNESILLAGHNDLPGALEKIGKARELAPDSSLLLQNYLSLMLRAGNNQDLLDQTNPMLDKYKGIWWFMVDRGEAKKNLGDTDGATADFTQAITAAVNGKIAAATIDASQAMGNSIGVDPAISALTPMATDQFSAKIALALLQHSKRDDIQAITTLEAISDLDHLSTDDKASYYSTAARIYATSSPQPYVDKAYASYRKLFDLVPNDYHDINDLACLLVDVSDPPRIPEALEYAQKANDLMMRSGKTEPAILDTLGWCLILSGTLDTGVEDMQKVIDLNPFPEAYLHLGEGYLRMEYPDVAMQQAKLGLGLLDKDPKGQGDTAKLRSKLQDLLVRSQDKNKAKQDAQAQ